MMHLLILFSVHGIVNVAGRMVWKYFVEVPRVHLGLNKDENCEDRGRVVARSGST